MRGSGRASVAGKRGKRIAALSTGFERVKALYCPVEKAAGCR